MDKNLDIISKAVIMAGRFSGRARKRNLKRLATMDADTKDKELLFLRDKDYQLQMQVSVLQKRVRKQQRKPRYTIRERLFILWHMETFQSPRRKVCEQLGVSRSTLYRWLNLIQDDDPIRIPANKTPREIAALIGEIAKSNISWGRVRIANDEAALLGTLVHSENINSPLLCLQSVF